MTFVWTISLRNQGLFIQIDLSTISMGNEILRSVSKSWPEIDTKLS